MSNFVIYTASAGSGKTYTLVRDFLYKCFVNGKFLSHKNLLAVTFTNKAAYEMRKRVISTLFSFTQKEKEPLFKYFQKRLNWTESELEKKSNILLSNILHDYTNLSISTIDKFSYKIIRDFSYELNLNYNFEVEIDDAKFSKDISELIINELGSNDSLTKSLLNFSEYKLYQNKSWDIELDLENFIKKTLSEDTFLIQKYLESITHNDIIFEQKKIIKSIQQVEKEINDYAIKIERIISGIPEKSFFKSYVPKLINNLRSHKYKNNNKPIFSEEFKQCVINSKWFSKNTSLEIQEKIEIISLDLHNILSNFLDYLDKKYPIYLFEKVFYNSLFVLSIYHNIISFIRQYKEEKNFLNISDFNRLISSFIQGCSVPFIYEKIGSKYNHYFIDEFQDTSVLQWNNLNPLIHEATSSEYGSCMIVGDSKQSIYRWRGGETSQFLGLCKNEIWNNIPIELKNLEFNWRSSKYIVEFNNNFFTFLSSKIPEHYRDVYSKVEQKFVEKKSGYVELSFVEGKSYSKIEEKTLQEIYKSIQGALIDGYKLSDITIITRKKKQLEIISEYLVENNISIYSSESLLLKNCNHVQFLINNFRIILKEHDYKSKVFVLDYLIKNKFINTHQAALSSFIFKNARCENDYWNNFLKGHNINYNTHQFSKQSLYDLAENLCREFKLFSKNSVYIISFLDAILDYSKHNGNSISDFLDWWLEKEDKLSVSVSKGDNTVELMTIHKSKGLEFPIVIFPFANWKLEERPSKIWTKIPAQVSEKIKYSLLSFSPAYKFWSQNCQESFLGHEKNLILDNINLLYVTLTRAQERLYIFSNKNSRSGSIYKYFEEFVKSKNLSHEKYIIGARQNKINKLKNEQSYFIENYISVPWKERLHVKSNRIYNWESSINKAINFGNLIHKLMSEVVYANDVSKLNYTELDKLDAVNINDQIRTIICDKKINHLFQKNKKVIIERAIIDKNKSIWRPDRIVIHDPNWVSVLDYKTGEYKEGHKSQILNYKKLFTKMGYSKVEGYLVYIMNGEILKY